MLNVAQGGRAAVGSLAKALAQRAGFCPAAGPAGSLAYRLFLRQRWGNLLLPVQRTRRVLSLRGGVGYSGSHEGSRRGAGAATGSGEVSAGQAANHLG